MADFHQFVRVEFQRFKAFKSFTLNLRHFNILVGPNNAGKSTILAAFRILAAAMRRANARNATLINGPNGLTEGHKVDLTSISVAEENIFFDYDDSEPATIRFSLSNKNTLTLYFPEQGTCILIPDAGGKRVSTPSSFSKYFRCPIGFVPVLGPVDHHESLFEKEAARLALFNYRAARNFRNIWYHYPERFDEFRTLLQQTWPGMDIERPEIERSSGKPRLYMYCPEQRRPRELYWAGFGFQVWCQMLTHLIQSHDCALFLIDEPDIYLHSELQRQLLGLLRTMGPDIVIATHSTELITEADTDDIVLINKTARTAKRIKNPSQLEAIFQILGSNVNPILTQLAKTRRVLFVEGKDFQILGKFARKCGFTDVGNRRDFAVVPVEGFNPERIKSLKKGMETTLGNPVSAAAILDKDYRSEPECSDIQRECKQFCAAVIIHKRKEIENFLLVPAAIDRAVQLRLADKVRRVGGTLDFIPIAAEALDEFSNAKKAYVASQLLAERRRFERAIGSGLHDAQIGEVALSEFEKKWALSEARLCMIPGKEALAFVNSEIQKKYGVSLTPTGIIDAMEVDEIPLEIRDLISALRGFSIQHLD